MSWPLGIAYGEPKEPFWGAPTSHMNFCEEDYILTSYAAEAINTISSFAYIAYGIHGIRRAKGTAHSALNIEALPYYGLVGVALASSIYHATLQYHTQMADEMSMHFAMGCVLIRIFSFDQPKEVGRRNTAIIATGLTTFIIYHCITDEFVLHAILFLSMVFLVIWKTRRIIQECVRDPAQKAAMYTLATFGTAIAFFAYFLWNIDVFLCPSLTRLRRSVGYPFGILLELHGWWHVLTAVAAYTFIAMIEFLTHEGRDESHGRGLLWPVKPVLEGAATEKPANGKIAGGTSYGNGNLKQH